MVTDDSAETGRLMELMELVNLHRLCDGESYLKIRQRDDRLTVKMCHCAFGYLWWKRLTAPDNDRCR